MNKLIYLAFLFVAVCAFAYINPEDKQNNDNARNYYISTLGNDYNDGSVRHPIKTIARLNNLALHAGDTILFKAGETFTGTIHIDSGSKGSIRHPVVLTSYGGSNATIDAANTSAIEINHTAFITVHHLTLKASGRKAGNTKDGLVISNSSHISIDHIETTGFQKAGVLVYKSANIKLTHVFAHDNGFAGISVAGDATKNDCRNIYIGYCTAENNPGDPTNLTNHSGNGIIAGFCSNVLIEYCTATNNGWDMPRKGNGPVGIWCYEADSVVMQYCIAYRNKTALGAADGGGFDFDGGTTHSLIQYCLSYENEGSAFGLFQYDGASPWHDNTIRFCISENDGTTSAAHAGVFIWNGARDTAQLRNCWFYNNTIYNNKGAAISYAPENENAGFYFYNNIFVAKDELIYGKETNGTFLGNDWWSIKDRFLDDSIHSFALWTAQKGKEQLAGKLTGLNINPEFNNQGAATITDPLQLPSFFRYRLPKQSILRTNGINLKTIFGMDTGTKDFNGHQVNANEIGACSW